MKPILCLLTTLWVTTTFAKENHHISRTDTLTTSAIFNKSEAAYASLKIYLDSGKVIQEMDISSRTDKTAKYFKTAYSSDGKFNFEYYDAGRANSLYTINRSADVVKTWWGTTNKAETPANINMALGAAVGVSSSTSSLIPNLLLTNDFKKSMNIYHRIKNPIIINIEPINGVSCYKIDGTESSHGKITLWISKKDFLIRKIETINTVNPDKTHATIKRLDSVVRSKHLTDTAYLKKDSLLQAQHTKIDGAVQEILSNAGISMKEFIVKDTYFYFPTNPKKANPELFKFRPNREVAL